MRGMNDMLRQAQALQKKMSKLQDDLADREVSGTAGGGMITVVCTGKQEIRSIVIDKNAVDPEDVEMLQDLVLAAANDALRKSKEMAESEMGALTGGMNIPGMF
ncbi:YbaB/EbfC family nucleoid-associated protein [Halodesulfovibrio sp. MK-HDV]|jgi:nucleoid-associated protein EbfC|uniref:YbaB/EbfC family nucleoid-associated protein n=1 Tax=unclassified Halodesulfovibrio TaxID=2644657 RepID=UPI00136F467E|nr:YbaB/EbfC family nucleoid-associated protein [Halodesulfovibrio sp. MK-HDV]KAF1076460.1 Nucleoid-associated protein [Halodesulfovibrio sp. MK-HDV]